MKTQNSKQYELKIRVSPAAGFGLIEAIVAAAILSFAILTSVTVTTFMLKPALASSLAISLEILNGTITSSLQNDTAWFNTVQDPANAGLLGCVSSQNDCSGAVGNLNVIRDAGNSVIFDGSSPQNGYDVNGSACTSYSLISPDSQCIVQLTVAVTPICSATPCLNPAFKFGGKFKVSSPANMFGSLNMGRFNFPSLRQEMLYHATQAQNQTLNVDNAGVNCAAGKAVANSAALSYPNGDCTSAVTLQPANYSLTFQYTFGYSGGAASGDVANQSSICFFNASSTSAAGCLFEWRQNQQNWALYSNNSLVFTPPASAPATGSPNFTFTMRNGLMLFYYNSQRLFAFGISAHVPLKVALYPGSTSYAPNGFNPVTFQF